MLDIETINLLKESANEIRLLRKRNDILEAQVGMVETLTQFLHAAPPQYLQQGSETIDIAWSIDRLLQANEIRKEPAAAPPTETDLLDQIKIEYEQQADGTWKAEIPCIPGIAAHGTTWEIANRQIRFKAVKRIVERFGPVTQHELEPLPEEAPSSNDEDKEVEPW